MTEEPFALQAAFQVDGVKRFIVHGSIDQRRGCVSFLFDLNFMNVFLASSTQFKTRNELLSQYATCYLSTFESYCLSRRLGLSGEIINGEC